MARILVIYDTGEGQTAKVAEHVRDVLVDRGHDVRTIRVGAGSPAVSAYDAVVVGSPVNNQAHLPSVASFVRESRVALADRPTAFFQVSMAMALPYGWARSGMRTIADEFFEEVGWHPDWLGLFAGAVDYPSYGFLERQAFRLVAAVTTGDTDTSRRYEYTDWETVERFATGFGEHVEETVGRGSQVRRVVRRVVG